LKKLWKRKEWNPPSKQDRMPRTKQISSLLSPFPANIGHRGAKGISPENTIVSFLMGSEYTNLFELDTMLCKTGEPVVIHDFTVDRTTDGTGAVRNLSLKELKSLESGLFFSEDFEGETIPTLQEVVESLPQTTIFDIELKSQQDPKEREQLVAKVLKLIDQFHLVTRSFVSSFDWEILKLIQKENPNLLRGYLLEKGDKLPANYLDYEPDLILPHFTSVTKEFVSQLKKENLGVVPYTVNDPSNWEKCLGAGVIGLISDFPDRLRDYLSTKK